MGDLRAHAQGPSAGNPFVEVDLSARFTQGDRARDRPRLLRRRRGLPRPLHARSQGEWRYETRATPRTRRQGRELQRGEAVGRQPRPGAGAQQFHFAYADGTPYFPVGTTCYAWIHQGDELEEQTLATLKPAPFNKMRMCVFPKWYAYNQDEPPLLPVRRHAAARVGLRPLQPGVLPPPGETDRPAPRPRDRGRPDPVPPLRQGALGLRPHGARRGRPLPALRGRPPGGVPEHPVPVGLLLLLHEVELVGQRPPDVAEGRQPGDDVAQVAVVRGGLHAVEAPVALVVGVEQDQVGLDPQVAELADPLLEVAEERRVEAGEVPVARRRPGERVAAAARSG